MSSNELGIFARTFSRPSIEEYFSAVARHGLGIVQYNMACAGLPTLPEFIPTELAGRIRAAAGEQGIRIAAVSGTFNMIHPDLARRRSGLRGLRALASACALLGTRTITLCTGTRDPDDMWRGHPANTAPDAWSDLLHMLDAALVIADEFDLQLGIEPETANVVDSPASARRLMHEMRSPRVKIVLDPANLGRVQDLERQQSVLDEAFDVLGPHIIMAHAKDVREVDGAIHHVAAGTGRLDYAYYLRRLSQVPAPLIIHGLSELEVPASLAFLRAKAGEVDRAAETAAVGT